MRVVLGLTIILTGSLMGCLDASEDADAAGNVHLPVPSFVLSPNVPKTTDDVRVDIAPVNQLSDVSEPVWHVRWTSGTKVYEQPILTQYQTRSGEQWNVEVWYTLADQESVHIDYDFVVQDSSAGIELGIRPIQPRSDEDIEGFTNVLDPDYHILDIQYRWTRNGLPLDWQDNIVPASMTTKGDIWTLTLQSLNGVAITQSPIHQFSIRNTPPVLSGGSIFPIEPDQLDVLTVNLDVFDHDEDTLQPEYRWFLNGRRLDGITAPSLALEPYEREDQIFAEVRVFDGEHYSDWIQTQPVVIQNTPPTIGEIVLSNDNPASNESMTCGYVGYDDLDRDPDNSSISWVRNGQEVGSGAFLDLDQVYAQPFQYYYCIVRASDGIDLGQVYFKRFRIRNTPPTVFAVDLTPGNVFVDSPLSCTPTNVQDIDGTNIFDYEYEWYVNGNKLNFSDYTDPPAVIFSTDQVRNPDSSSIISEIDAFQKGDTVVCSVAADDRTGNNQGVGAATYSNGIQVQNSIPTATGIEFDPPNPNREDIVHCNIIDYLDLDDDDNLSIKHWYKNGQYIYTGDSINLFLQDAQLTDVFTCQVQLFDGEDYGAQFSISTQATNQAPQVLSVEVTPENPTSQDTISAMVVYDDPDGDLVTLNYLWYVDNVLQSSTSNQLVGPFVPGEIVRLDVEPFDGIVSGPILSSVDVEVVNSPPNDPDIQLIQDGDGLLCELLQPPFDQDGDVVSISVDWLCDSVLLNSTLQGQAIESQLVTDAYSNDRVPASLVSDCILWQCTMQAGDSQDVSASVYSNLLIP